MTQEPHAPAASAQPAAPGAATAWIRSLFEVKDLVVVALLVIIYRNAAHDIHRGWTLVDSYYSHGFLIPFVCLFFVWRDRKVLAALPRKPSAWGYPWVAAAALMLFVGDFLGFGVLTHMSLIPMITGALLLTHGAARTRTLWFPIAFLFFMIPIPASITQSFALKLKLVATESVQLANLFTLPMVREGSYVHFGDDFLLVGEVCGGPAPDCLLAQRVDGVHQQDPLLARAFLFLVAARRGHPHQHPASSASASWVFLRKHGGCGHVPRCLRILIFLIAFICFSLRRAAAQILPARENPETAP